MLLLTLSTTIENTVEPHTPLCISSSTIVVFAVLSQSSSTIAPQLGDEYCDPRFKVDQVANHQNFGIHHKCCGGRCFFKREWLSTVQYYDLNKSEHIIQAGVIPLVILSRQLNYVTVGIWNNNKNGFLFSWLSIQKPTTDNDGDDDGDDKQGMLLLPVPISPNYKKIHCHKGIGIISQIVCGQLQVQSYCY